MKADFTEIVFILDQSGSMEPLRDQAIAAYNEFLKEQRQQPGDTRMSLVLFSDEHHVVVDSRPAAAIPLLTRETYEPAGPTALLDAIGRSIDTLGERLSAMPEAGRPGLVIVAIFTDGEENSSQHFKWGDISNRIRRQTRVYNWKFLFLGANQDAIATAAKMSIDAVNAAQVVADAHGVGSLGRVFSRKSTSFRRHLAAPNLTVEEQAELSKPLEEIAKEEDHASRRNGPDQVA